MELGFGSLRGQLVSIVTEKEQESKKREGAEAEAEAQRRKATKLEQEKESLQGATDARMDQAQGELRALQSAYEQLRSAQSAEAEQQQAAQGQLAAAQDKVKSLAAELVAVQTAARSSTSKLSQAEVQMSGFTHASASFEQNYNAIQQQIALIREGREQNSEALGQMKKANESLVAALRKSEAELSGHREREDTAARAAARAIDEKQKAQLQSALAEAEILRLQREHQLEVELNRRNLATTQHAEAERANVLHIIAEYEKIDALHLPPPLLAVAATPLAAEPAANEPATAGPSGEASAGAELSMADAADTAGDAETSAKEAAAVTPEADAAAAAEEGKEIAVEACNDADVGQPEGLDESRGA